MDEEKIRRYVKYQEENEKREEDESRNLWPLLEASAHKATTFGGGSLLAGGLIPRSLLRSFLRTNTWALTRIQSITLQNQHTSELAPGLLICMKSPC
jgi:hypothetical protein